MRSESRSLYKRRFLSRLTVFMTAAVYACLLTYGVVIYVRVRAQVREEALREDMRFMGLVNYCAERLVDSVQKTAIGLFYSLDVQRVIHASPQSDQIYLLGETERINDIATANTNVLSVELYNGRLAKVFAGPNAPSNDETAVRSILRSEPENHRLEIRPRRVQASALTGADSSLVLSLVMFDTPAGRAPAEDGALIMNIDPKWLFDSFDLINRNTGQGTLCALSPEGAILHPAPRETPFSGADLRRSLDRLGTGPVRQGLARIGRSDYIVTAVTPRGSRFTLVQIRSAELAYARYSHILNVLPLMSALFVAFPFAIIVFLARRLYQPLKLLVGSVDAGPNRPGIAAEKDEFSYLASIYRSNRSQLENLREREQSNQAIVRSFMLRNLLFDSEHVDRRAFLDSSASMFRMSFRQPLLLVLLSARASRGMVIPGGLERAKSAMAEITRVLGIPFEAVEMDREELALILATPSVSPTVRDGILVDLREAIAICNRAVGIDLAVALSDWITDLSQVTPEVHRCRHRLLYAFVLGLNVIIQEQDVERYNEDCHPLEAVPYSSKLRSAVIYGDLNGFRRTLQASIRKIARQPIEHVLASASELIGVYVAALRSRRELGDVSPRTPLSDVRKAMEGCPTIGSLETSLLANLQGEFNSEDAKGHSKRLILVDAVKDYVARNFTDRGLYVPKIAAAFKVNPTYLGRVFRTMTGMGLVDYIHFLRIEKAKSLLRQTALTVSEVMERTGFENKSNFYRLFKRSSGMSPREYVVRHPAAEPSSG